MAKQYLFTAGPTPVPERVNLALAQPMIYHRAPAFQATFTKVRSGLQWLFETKRERVRQIKGIFGDRAG